MSNMSELPPAVDFKEVITLDPKKTALLVVDMQNGFVEEGAQYESRGGREIIPSIEKLIKFCRDNAIAVIWSQSDHSYPASGIFCKKFPPIGQAKYLWKGTKSFEIYKGMLQPTDKEYRIVKHKYDVFYETDLESILRNLGLDTLIITGVTTDVCVEFAARSAICRDIKAVVATDCCAALLPGEQEASIIRISMFFGRTMTADEIISELRERL